MKKSLLALAVLGAFAGAAQAQSSVTIYGIVDTGIAYTSKTVSAINPNGTISTGSKLGLNSGVLQGSRIGFKGVEDLGGGLSAVFNLESGFANDTGALQGDTGSTNLFRRKSVVGLAGGFGTVLLGRQTDFLDDIGGSMTSVADFGGWTQNSGSNLSRLQGTRTNNSIRYNTANLGGFTGSLIYGFGEQSGKTSAGQAYGIGGKYENGPLSLAAAYYQSKLAANSTTAADVSLNNGNGNGTGAYTGNPGDTAVKTFTLAAQYQFGAAKVYGNWSRTKQPNAQPNLVVRNVVIIPFNTSNVPTGWVIGGTNNDKTDTFELGTAYSLSPSLKLLAAVDHSRINYVNAGAPKGKLTQISLGADYWLSKRTDLYALVANMRASDTVNPGITGGSTGTDASQTAVAFGIRHKF
ncbi:porin [Herbaspirillum rubrisubalbicans]|uniref:Porin n=1 Tax=Herbaspirillum rubrisubalbicans TaxID=80842 RepID=A0ABX9BZK7_9BURK|nr:porin [Herbaspirillum rubrisubalbicans]RAM63496.1 porin [Herbaspirillum rubrisubalbicans]RAN48715.1 porin [Herbaspirillum rubrisubalbicans]